MNVSIAIPTYNRAKVLKHTLSSLLRLKIPAGCNIEVLVIDNNCSDETAEVFESASIDAPFPHRRIVESRQGLCYCRNRALGEALYEHVLYLDDDIEISPDWLIGYDEALGVADADCVVGPVFPVFDERLPSFITPRVAESLGSPYSRKGNAMVILPPDVAHEVPGCNFAVRKAVALAIGGFDPTLDRAGGGLLAGGDFEFGERLVSEHKRIVYHPSCWIHHIITVEKLSRAYLRRRWFGIGATARVMSHRRGRKLSKYRFLRCLFGVLRLRVRAAISRITQPEAIAFERELDALLALGYLLGPVKNML